MGLFRGHSCNLPTSGKRRLGGLCWHEWLFVAAIAAIGVLAVIGT